MEPSGFWKQADSIVRTWGLIALFSGAVAAFFISRHDVDTVRIEWKNYTEENQKSLSITNSTLEKVNMNITDLKVTNATLSSKVETFAGSVQAIAAAAVTQTQMAEHVRAADIEHEAMRKEIDNKFSGLQKQVDGVSGRVDRLERQRDGDGKH